MKKIIVMKFGGTSVSRPSSVRTIAQRTRENQRKGLCAVIVVSALSGVTEMLLSLLQAPVKSLPSRMQTLRTTHMRLVDALFESVTRDEIATYIDKELQNVEAIVRKKARGPQVSDSIVSFGEIMSSYIIARFLETNGLKAQAVSATDVIATDSNFTNAEFIPAATNKNARRVLKPLIQRGIVPIVTGFIGATLGGKTTTLGRGGSDYSASIIGNALDASEIQIWTDVDGIYSSDPRAVRAARRIRDISYREASEMAAFGAKVLHPRTIRPAVDKNIPIRVLNTFNPRGSGTTVSARARSSGLKAIAFKRTVALVNIYSDAMLFSRGFLVRIFETFAKHNISVDLVSVSEVSVSVTLDNSEKLDEAVRELRTFASVSADRTGFGVVSLIGEKISSAHELTGKILSLVQHRNIPVRMISMGASDINVSFVIPARDIVRTVSAIHNRFIGMRNTTSRV